MIAAITAGGRVGGAFAAAIGTPVKALAPVGSRTLLRRAVEAAWETGASAVVVVGGDEVRDAVEGSVTRVIGESRSGRENLRRALCAAGSEPLLLLTSDLPFVTGPAITDFLGAARGFDAAMALAGEGAYREAYPGAPAHLTRVGSERVVGGSVFFFGPGVPERILESAQALFDARKSLLRMALLLGPALLTRFVTGRLRIEDVEHRANRLFGIRAGAIRNCAPALCYDVDTEADYRYAIERHATG